MIFNLDILEFILISFTFVGSVGAIFGYAINLKYSFPKEESFKEFVNIFYTLNRVVHVALFVVVGFSLFVFGIFDNNSLEIYDSSVKIALLTINAGVLILLNMKMLSFKFAPQVVVSTWVSLTVFNSYKLFYNQELELLSFAFVYAAILIIIYSIFYIIKKVYEK